MLSFQLIRGIPLWPGASSSGPAVAVAARLCPIALASDAGGSIRAPAAAWGITGLMPSQGRVSRHGAFPLAPTLERIGPFATSALDCAHMLRAIAGVDPADPAALDERVPDYASQLGTGLRGLRLGFDEGILNDCDPEIGAPSIICSLGSTTRACAFPLARFRNRALLLKAGLISWRRERPMPIVSSTEGMKDDMARNLPGWSNWA